MNDNQKIVPPENQDLIREEALRQQSDLQDKVIECNWRLTQHNFLANAGGAVAILGFMGSDKSGTWAIYSLLFFALGIICSAIEVRALLEIFGDLHKAVTESIDRISGKVFSVEEALIRKDAGRLPGRINMMASYISQACFIIGVFIGGGAYIWAL